ncbi:hypothetical protein WA171_004356 [Blastocystis sp. BT1]
MEDCWKNVTRIQENRFDSLPVLYEISGCSCNNNCDGNCSCCQLSHRAEHIFDNQGRIRTEFLKELDLLPSIYECHSQCRCHGLLCGNSSRVLDVTSFVIQKTRDKGYGLFATVDIPAGSVVVEYVGEVIRHKEANKRLEASDMVYILEIREQYTNMTIRTCIDATNFGNESRFINHACESNCGILLVRKGSIIPHVFFIAKRLIKKGEEITIHYGGVSIPSKRVPCRCGCSSCCGFIPFSI